MGRLRQIPQRIGTVSPRLASLAPKTEAERARQRRDLQAWRSWYNTARWRKLRWSVLVEAMFACRRCGRTEGDTSQLVADHIEPHRGRDELFWDRANLQCLCKRCHDTAKQAEERRRPD